MDRPFKADYGFLETCHETEIVATLSQLCEARLKLSRSVVISSVPHEGDLGAHHESFDYHTDGTFLTTPPAYIALQLLSPCEGGEIRIFDSSLIAPCVPDEVLFFGTEGQGVTAKIIDRAIDNSRIFRYRRDYMTPLVPQSGIYNFHGLLAECGQLHFQSLGFLSVGKTLFMNNWQYLHFRGPFTGERRIRRLWFDYAEEGMKELPK